MTTGSEDKTTYAMVASGPAVPAEEVERAEQALDVIVMWGEQALHVAHLAPPRPFYIGEGTRGDAASPDFSVGAETLGVSRLPIVLDGASGPVVVVPNGATLTVTIDDATRTLAELEAAGHLAPCAELAGARQYALPAKAIARVEHEGFAFVVRPTAAGKKIGVGFSALVQGFDRTTIKYIGGSLALSALMLSMMYFLPPSGRGVAIDDITAESRIVDYLDVGQEVQEIEEQAPWLNEESGPEGERAADEEGQMGDREAQVTKNRSGIPGPENNPDQHMANREAERQAAETAGVLGVLAQMQGAWDQPTSPFGRETAVGSDPMAALGAIMGDQIGANFGFNGLGMRGTGRGGGGDGRGTYGVGEFGTIGSGTGCDDRPAGQCRAGTYGNNVGLGDHGPSTRVPTLRPGPVETVGGLSAETIRRVVNRHRNEVRFCYEQELRESPDLEGRVTVQFIISPTGAVQSSAVVGARTNLASNDVSSCVASAVQRWGFPQPENGGVVSVTYPFMFSTN